MNIRLQKGFYIDGNRLVNLDMSVNTSPAYYSELRHALRMGRASGHELLRVGGPHDGGYLMLDPIYRGGYKEECVAYSFGVGRDVSWDDAMADKGYDIFMYDPTVEGLPKERKEFHFFREGIAGHPVPEQKMDTLAHFLERNGHTRQEHMILKMDVEGAEWDFFSTATPDLLERFDQMVFEFHGLTEGRSLEGQALILQSLRKINQTHQLIHVHGCNCGDAIYVEDRCFPNILEATYARRGLYTFTDGDAIVLPHPLDSAVDPYRPDLILGKWNG